MRNEQDGYTYRGSGKCRCGAPVDYFRRIDWIGNKPHFRWLISNPGRKQIHLCHDFKKDQTARDQPDNLGGNKGVRA
jgi:hypothetical protein